MTDQPEKIGETEDVEARIRGSQARKPGEDRRHQRRKSRDDDDGADFEGHRSDGPDDKIVKIGQEA